MLRKFVEICKERKNSNNNNNRSGNNINRRCLLDSDIVENIVIL